jgi:BASS family bile acid:Na+ symporter
MYYSLRSALGVPVQALAWLGSQGTRAVAALVVIGIAIPPLGEILRPFVTEAIFLLLCISFLRVDLDRLHEKLQKPKLIVAATMWTMLGVPLISAVCCRLTGLDTHDPALFLALMLQAIASPMMAAPALASLMGLDATLVLLALMAGTALVPFTSVLFAQTFLSSALTISPVLLGLKLLAMLSGSLAFALCIRFVCGASLIERCRRPIDGVNILVLLVFVSAVMGNVVTDFVSSPAHVVAVALLSFVVFFALLGTTMVLFRAVGYERAFALGMMVAQRNMGLMLAATSGVLPPETWLYFAVSQFPIYLSPQLLLPLARRLMPQSVKSIG